MKELDLKRKLEKKLERIDRELAVTKARNSEKLRKERAHKLIKLGALFEISDLMEVSESILLGYLLCFKNYENPENLKYWNNLGSNKMIERLNRKQKVKKELPKKDVNFTHQDILCLLKDANSKNINIINIAQKNFKKNILENLSYEQFMFLRNFLDNFK